MENGRLCKWSEEMFAQKLYRFSNKLYTSGNVRAAKLAQNINNQLNNSYIPCSAKIGKNSKFAYGAIGIVIHDRAVIGDNVTIGQNTTIGGNNKSKGVPIIKNNVYISCGARIIGDITVGNNVIIGANSVVIRDVPDNSIVAGVPATVISSNIKRFKDLGWI